MSAVIEPKPPVLTDTVAFRINGEVKALAGSHADHENLELSDICRTIFYAGLKEIYAVSVRGHLLVDGSMPPATTPEIRKNT